MNTLEGKSALITGSTGGIGFQIAQTLAAEGANIILNGFGPADEITAMQVELESKYGVGVYYDDADLTQPKLIEKMCDTAQEKFETIDILVNNAGIQHVALIDEFPVEKWDLILAINLTASFHTIRKVLPAMKSRGWGRVINIASTHGLVGSPTKAPYAAAKHGLVGLTKAVALEAAPHGVTVNAVAPGYVRTILVERQIEALSKENGISLEDAAEVLLNQKHASGKFASAHHIAAAVAYLCSDGADSTTGITLPVDGGWTAH